MRACGQSGDGPHNDAETGAQSHEQQRDRVGQIGKDYPRIKHVHLARFIGEASMAGGVSPSLGTYLRRP